MNLIDDKELFIFDFDGTLVDTSRDILAAVNYIRNEYALDHFSFKEAAEYIGVGQKALIEGIVSEKNEVDIDEAVELFRNYYESNLTKYACFYPGVENVLQELTNKGKKLAIFSNKYSYYIEEILGVIDSQFYFEIILGADNAPARRPDPAGIGQIKDFTKVSLEDIVMIGDSELDIFAGKSAGVSTVGCLYGFGKDEVLKSAEAEYYIDDFQDLLRRN